MNEKQFDTDKRKINSIRTKEKSNRYTLYTHITNDIDSRYVAIFSFSIIKKRTGMPEGMEGKTRSIRYDVSKLR